MDGSGEDCTIFLLVAVEDTNGNLQYRPADGNDPLRVRQTGQEHQSGQRTVRLDLRTISFQRNLEDKTGFVRDGSHLLQEIHSDGRYTYLNSYKPLAQVRDWATDEGES